MTPSHAIKQGVRYRYYVSTPAMQGRDRAAKSAHRVPALALEATIIEALRSKLAKQGVWISERGAGIAAESQSANERVDGSHARDVPSPASTGAISSTEQARVLIDVHLVRVVIRPDRLDIEYRAQTDDPSATGRLSVPWEKPISRVRRARLDPELLGASRRLMESDERDRLIRGIGRARSWLDGLIKGTIVDTAELAARFDRTERSIRQTLSLAFLDPALIDAACSGQLPRGYGVTRLTDLPSGFADQWRALGLQRPA